jgi:hypothetical protein
MSCARWIWTEGDGWVWTGDDGTERQGTAIVVAPEAVATVELVDPYGRKITTRVVRRIGYQQAAR